MKNRILLFVMSIFGAASCAVEYGSPYATYSVKGAVSDADGNPIPNIAVFLGDDDYEEVTLRTDAGGRFAFGRSVLYPLSHGKLTFVDDDGEANGGEFATAEVNVDFVLKNKPGRGSSWFEGDYDAPDVEVTLVRKADVPPQESDADE